MLGAGLELGYLLALATNQRFQRHRHAQAARRPRARNGTTRIAALLAGSTTDDRARYEALAERCRSIIDLQTQQRRERAGRARSAGRQPRPAVVDVPAAARRPAHDLPGARRRRQTTRTSQQTIGGARAAAASDRALSDELRAQPRAGSSRSCSSASSSATDADRKLAFIDAELERIEQQVELIREQAALSTDPELLSRRIDEIAATLGGTGQWIRDQQQVYGAMEDLLTEPPPLTPDARAQGELQ